MSELILSGFLGAALVALGIAVYIFRRDFERDIDQLKADMSEAMNEANLKIGGFKDHIASQNLNIELMEKTMAEFTKNMDADVLQKMQDRLGLVEMATGVRRLDSKRPN